jgi:predicted membrane protein
MKTLNDLTHELKHHIPFTALATIIAISIVIFIKYFSQTQVSNDLFNILHPIHIIASAIVTTAIFYKYKKNYPQAILVGILGAIIMGSLSDIIFPWLGGNILGLSTEFHLPLIEETSVILVSALIGSLLGLATKFTRMPHFFHVFLSVFASLFYLLAFSNSFNTLYFIGAFFITFIAVIIPCCISDIIFPFLFLGEKIKKCNC